MVGEFMVAFLLVFIASRTAVNSEFFYSSMACFAIGAQHEPLLIHEGVPFALPAPTKSIRFLRPGGRLGLRLETRHLRAVLKDFVYRPETVHHVNCCLCDRVPLSFLSEWTCPVKNGF